MLYIHLRQTFYPVYTDVAGQNVCRRVFPPSDRHIISVRIALNPANTLGPLPDNHAKEADMHHIGILQLTEHLDDTVRGFTTGLASLNLSTRFEYLTADGDERRLPDLAGRLAESGAQLIFACSTPAALAAVKTCAPLPVVFAPVFDPVAAGLAASLDRPGGAATGMCGAVPMADRLGFISRLLPKARLAAVVHHIQDPVSLADARLFLSAGVEKYRVVPIPVGRIEELSHLWEKLPRDCDLIYLPAGKALEENFATIAYYAAAARIPVITSSAACIAAGAAAAVAADHYELGFACAGKAAKILLGIPPGLIPVGAAKPSFHLNRTVSAELGLELPPELTAVSQIYG